MIDLVGTPNVTLAQALALSSHEMIWAATLRSGTVILEQPGLSSDHLPRDEVSRLEYVPARRRELPTITCQFDLDKGERFVRYWTTIWRNGGGTQRVFVLGIERDSRFAMLAYYPAQNKVVFAAKKPFTPPWQPETFSLLPPGIIVRGGPGSSFVEWVHEGFGVRLVTGEKQLVMAAVYE